MNWVELIKGIGTFIQTVGVPAAVAFFVLYRLDSTVNKMAEAMSNLSGVVTVMNTKLDDFFERRKTP